MGGELSVDTQASSACLGHSGSVHRGSGTRSGARPHIGAFKPSDWEGIPSARAITSRNSNRDIPVAGNFLFSSSFNIGRMKTFKLSSLAIYNVMNEFSWTWEKRALEAGCPRCVSESGREERLQGSAMLQSQRRKFRNKEDLSQCYRLPAFGRPSLLSTLQVSNSLPSP